MCRNLLSLMSNRTLALMVLLVALSQFGVAQYNQASPPIADPADKRFVGVTEDRTTPALDTSHLKVVPAVSAFTDDGDGFTGELVQLQWRFGDPLDVWVVKPKGVKNPPVILYLYSYPSDTDTFKNIVWQKAVTKDGFAAVGFVSALTGHRYHDRPMKEWFISDLQECLATSAHDVQMVLNYLSVRGDLDMNRVGLLGEGSGASIAIMASAVDPRIKVLDTIDPWGDWPVWMATSPFIPKDERPDYVTPEYLKKVAALEPVDWLPKIQARKFRLQDAIFETDTPKDAKDKLRAAAPPSASVVIYHDLKEYRAAINGNHVMDWMHNELRALPEPPAATATSPAGKAAPAEASSASNPKSQP
jgi:hypothetical protein